MVKVEMNIIDNRKLKCIKEYSGDFEQYGIDFIIGSEYIAKSFDETSIYVESESGSDVEFYSLEELSKYFVNLTCCDCGKILNNENICEVDLDIKENETENKIIFVCSECYFENYV